MTTATSSISCCCNIHRQFHTLAPAQAHPGCPGERLLKWVHVCIWEVTFLRCGSLIPENCIRPFQISSFYGRSSPSIKWSNLKWTDALNNFQDLVSQNLRMPDEASSTCRRLKTVQLFWEHTLFISFSLIKLDHIQPAQTQSIYKSTCKDHERLERSNVDVDVILLFQ